MGHANSGCPLLQEGGGNMWNNASLEEQGVLLRVKRFGRVVYRAAGFVVNG